MNKNLLKIFNKLYNKPIVKVGIYVLGIFAIFYISSIFNNENVSFINSMISILTSQETMSVFLAGILSIGIAKMAKRCDYYLEESLKIDDNHHKIINMYSGHKKHNIDKNTNFADKNGVFMSLKHIGVFKKRELKNLEKDVYSKNYKNVQNSIDDFKDGKLFLPSLNVFTNITGDTKIKFNDKNVLYKLSDYVIANADSLFAAHQNSKKSNNTTIRLNDFYYEDNTLTFDTQRSTYYHMLITNRCMDFNFHEGITIRNLYEYKKTISLLNESKLGNQIGINGLILSNDGYVLIEKRDHNKTTWKNKFAQSISLALKEGDLTLNQNHIIGDTYEDANENLKHIISKTIKDNFGLTADDYDKFNLQDNFLGLARDLLEGGKPNLYFYVTTKYNADELAEKLIENASKIDKNALQTGKLASDYYLVPFEDICINYNYMLKLNRRKCYKVYRQVYPRSSMWSYILDKAKYSILSIIKPNFVRECGEALLVTISYLELCQSRIDAIKNK